MRILRYLKKALGRELLYSDYGHTRVACFLNADWAGCSFDRRSTIGYCVFLGEILCHEKVQEANCGFLVHCRVGVRSNDKCDIRANLHKRFIDTD